MINRLATESETSAYELETHHGEPNGSGSSFSAHSGPFWPLPGRIHAQSGVLFEGISKSAGGRGCRFSLIYLHPTTPALSDWGHK